MKVLLRNPRRELEIAGPVRAHALLERLGIARETVLVIRNDTLVPADAVLEDSDAVEIRPVISGGCAVKCRVCKEPAVIDVPRHNANFCSEHFLRMCRDQVAKAIDQFSMMEPGQRLLVAVSGGKDSLALWDILLDLGYDADGLYLGLGIGDYSEASGRFTRAFAARRQAHLVEIDLPRDHGFDIPTGARAARRAPCSACGLSKRHLFDTAALDGGYAVVATGHNLDDEAAVLFGNVLHWSPEFLGRQRPVLAERPGFPRKVKPLVRLSEREMAAYCVLRGIDYIVEECPMAVGNRHLAYKDALNVIEARSPGAKFSFYFSFLEHGSPMFVAQTDADRDALGSCLECGQPTTGEVCAFCRLSALASTAAPVTLSPRRARETRR